MDYDVEMLIESFMLDPVIAQVLRDQQAEIERLRKRNIELSWHDNPDRMGGQFTQEELNRDGWS